ncbi:hypothetical protein NE237_027846 [Protea cynaroides]|uniref:GAG-pre-integrase domain-containing protein n=1 Tax=Protea cynaroides TaxID=273540 RepID=A0A9Q0GPA6_9MAGN|nr:hypothetical protein NE237_027846 [Protea cynaroides]
MIGEAIIANYVTESTTIWHRRLGHMSVHGLKKDKEMSSSNLPQMLELELLKEVQNQSEKQLADTKGDEADEEHSEPGAETQEHEPCTYREAYESSDASQWRASIEEEMEVLYKYKTLDLVMLLNGRKAIGCKWVYKLKGTLMEIFNDSNPN